MHNVLQTPSKLTLQSWQKLLWTARAFLLVDFTCIFSQLIQKHTPLSPINIEYHDFMDV